MNSTCCVRIEDRYSGWLVAMRGVRQGCLPFSTNFCIGHRLGTEASDRRKGHVVDERIKKKKKSDLEFLNDIAAMTGNTHDLQTLVTDIAILQ